MIHINQHILKESKTRLENATMAGIDYKMTDKVINFIMKAMKNWQVKLAVRQTPAKVKIQREIF